LWQQLLLSWSWRSRARRGASRPLPFILLAVIYITALGAAGLFSSRVSQRSADVLIRSPVCGYFNPPSADSTNGKLYGVNSSVLDNAFSQLNYNHHSLTQSSNYVQACNGSSTLLPFFINCDIYLAQPFQDTTITKGYCPFAEGTCLDPENGVIQADTGLLNSNLALGINAPPQNRLGVRKVTECAPIDSVPYQSADSKSLNDTVDATMEYLYGPSTNGANYTYSLAATTAFHPQQAYNIQ
jgi:hypothetical protein